MGKRVFEVAKDLGVDHRRVLESCDKLNISVRNYMSELSDSEEARLRRDFESGRKVVERVQAPGVVRRRRRVPVQQAGPARPSAMVGRPAGPSGAGAVKTRRRVDPSKVEAPKVEAPKVEAPKVEAPKVEAEAAKAPVVETPTSPVVETSESGGETKAVEAPSSSAPEAPGADKTPAEAAPEAAPAAEAAPPPEKKAPAPPVAAPKPASAVRIRPPAPREGGAKILGSIPLEQLQQRTVQPRRQGANRRTGGPPGRRPGGPPGRGPGPRPSGPAGAASSGPMPPTGDQTRRRRGAPPEKGGTTGDRNKRGAAGAQAKTTRRRRVFNRDEIYRGSGPRNNRGRKRKMSSRKGQKTQITTPAAHKRVVAVDETIRVGELGKALGVKSAEVIRQLMGMGVMATINDEVDFDTAVLIAAEYDYEVANVAFDESEFLSTAIDEAEEVDPDAVLRAPVVTIMGHVDHGKTTLLDSIRSATVVTGEAGGITQHIGAYKVAVGEQGVVFLDTPGHAAFTSMRARGASVTDVVVLIVAADDGVMPQTEESINHAKAAGVPIIVAVNKCDKPDVDPERIKQELTQFDLVPEEWGGENMFVNISALNGTGVENLLESLALQAEVLELRANPKNPAFGSVIEARIDKGRGTVCTVLVQEGTLKKGDYVVAGGHYGRVRALHDDAGNQIKEAGPSTPVEVLGLNGVPSAGDSFHIVKNEKDARKVVSERSNKARTAAEKVKGPSAMDIFEAMGKAEKETQNVILKADVSGSYEAIKASLEDLSTDEVAVRLLHGGVGAITESDVDLAIASSAVIIGFNALMDGKAKRAAEREGVQVVRHSIIYELIDVVKALMSGLLSPETVEEKLGRAEVRAVFHIQKIGTVAGCFVTDGKVLRGSRARVFRNGEEIHSGKLSTLKRFKDDVREVTQGYECGLSVDGYKGIEEGDEIEVFEVKELQRTID